jgi:hypothetical protein
MSSLPLSALKLVSALVLSAGLALAADATQEFPLLPKPGAKVALTAGTYFTYGFTKPPKLGTSILKVEIWRADGQRDTSFTIKGDVDMPSMRGAHSTGPKPFALSRKGDYLLPAPLVMPGDWEVRFTFEQQGQTVKVGSYRFEL